MLVRPARPANVGAACRAMKNMGLRDLVLVGAAPGTLEDREARALAHGASDVLDGARPARDLGEAVAGCTLVVGTTGREARDAWTPRALAARLRELAGDGPVAFVFGPESSGLTTDELARCDLRLRIPTDGSHTSLNLAQAVLVVAYELHTAAGVAEGGPGHALAPAEAVEAAFAHLRSALLEVGFLDPQQPEAVLGELRALVARARPSPREVTLLRGLARQVGWAARLARGGGGTIMAPATAPPEVRAMSDLRVPTVPVAAELQCADGRSFKGRVFLAALSSRHSGGVRAEEWLNEPGRFFPFLIEGEERPVLMNKREVLVLSVPASPMEPEEYEGLVIRRVAIECEQTRLEGDLLIDMPPHQSRALDYLNRSEPFLTLYEGEREHLVQKERITRILELGDR